MLEGFHNRRPSVPVVEGIQRGQQVREKISHKTTALLNTHDAFNWDRKYKYHQLYQTFKKSLGIREDIRDKDEFDAAFSTLISQIDRNKAGALKLKDKKKDVQVDMQIVENDKSSQNENASRNASQRSSRQRVLTKLGAGPATVFNPSQIERKSYYLGQEKMHRVISTELNTPGELANDERETVTLNDEAAGEMSYRMVPAQVKFR